MTEYVQPQPTAQPQPEAVPAPDTVGPTQADRGGGGFETAPAVHGGEQVQAAMDETQARGYQGARTDPTPLENYTLAGVTSGKPTPETSTEAHAKAQEALRYVRPGQA